MPSSSSVFTCKVDSDCHGNGYCKNEFNQELERAVGKCMCLDQYKYKPDCSEYACKRNKISSSWWHDSLTISNDYIWVSLVI